MDTAAYLTRQGWLGSGHSLDPLGHGIAKPLLISKKTDLLGLGQRKNDVYADQWWARDFDTTLKHLNFGTDETTETPENVAWKTHLQPQERIVRGSPKRGFRGLGNGLYSHFVRGEGLSGTQTPEVLEQVKMDSCQKLQAMGNKDETSRRPKRPRPKKRKRESLTGKLSFSRHPNDLTPKMDVCGNETSKTNPWVVKKEFEVGEEEQGQCRTKPSFANIKKGSHKLEAASKTASKNKVSRKVRHRRR